MVKFIYFQIMNLLHLIDYLILLPTMMIRNNKPYALINIQSANRLKT